MRIYTQKYMHIKIDTRIRATANFIFSNRDLRLPQASAPSPSVHPPPTPSLSRDALQRRITFFSSREYFSVSSPPPFHPLERNPLLSRPGSRFWYFEKRRKRKKRYLYESVFLQGLFLPRLVKLTSRGVFLRARLPSRRQSTPFAGDRNEGRKWLTFGDIPGRQRTCTSHTDTHAPANVYNERPLGSAPILTNFWRISNANASRLCQRTMKILIEYSPYCVRSSALNDTIVCGIVLLSLFIVRLYATLGHLYESTFIFQFLKNTTFFLSKYYTMSYKYACIAHASGNETIFLWN